MAAQILERGMTNTHRVVWVAAACVGLSYFAYLAFAGPEDRAMDVACLRDLGHAIEGYRNFNRGELPPGTTLACGTLATSLAWGLMTTAEPPTRARTDSLHGGPARSIG